MKKAWFAFLVFLFTLAGCNFPLAESSSNTPTIPLPTLSPSPSPTPMYPPVEGAEPSDKVAAFYYPWYRTMSHDASWFHWDQGGIHPPGEIASDYYPLLGPYSSLNPEVVAQHFTWLRRAGVGVVITSWWGQGSQEDKAVPLLLQMGERYGIKVAFLIECYAWRTAQQLVDDVKYLYDRYGSSPAFYRTSEGSLWSEPGKQQGLFLMWAVLYPDSNTTNVVEPEYWRTALDEIHALPDGGLVIADENDSWWVTYGHFDGSYKYGVLDADMAEPYTFAASLPAGAWYIPGVNPGFNRTHIIGSEDFTLSPRRDGEAYAERWQAMFDLGVEPQMVAITTFNEWHEGTQIEPAQNDYVGDTGYKYQDYESLPPEGYLDLTREWVNTYLSYNWPETHKVTLRMTTTSDWTYLDLVDGGKWMQPAIISTSPEVTHAGADGRRFVLFQPIERAEAGQSVEFIFEVMIIPEGEDIPLVFEIGRGGLGFTRVEVLQDHGGSLVATTSIQWGDFANNADNSRRFELLPAEVIDQAN